MMTSFISCYLSNRFKKKLVCGSNRRLSWLADLLDFLVYTLWGLTYQKQKYKHHVSFVLQKKKKKINSVLFIMIMVFSYHNQIIFSSRVEGLMIRGVIGIAERMMKGCLGIGLASCLVTLRFDWSHVSYKLVILSSSSYND